MFCDILSKIVAAKCWNDGYHFHHLFPHQGTIGNIANCNYFFKLFFIQITLGRIGIRARLLRPNIIRNTSSAPYHTHWIKRGTEGYQSVVNRLYRSLIFPLFIMIFLNKVNAATTLLISFFKDFKRYAHFLTDNFDNNDWLKIVLKHFYIKRFIPSAVYLFIWARKERTETMG